MYVHIMVAGLEIIFEDMRSLKARKEKFQTYLAAARPCDRSCEPSPASEVYHVFEKELVKGAEMSEF
jgi:hypothetical protein